MQPTQNTALEFYMYGMTERRGSSHNTKPFQNLFLNPDGHISETFSNIPHSNF